MSFGENGPLNDIRDLKKHHSTANIVTVLSALITSALTSTYLCMTLGSLTLARAGGGSMRPPPP